MPRPAPSSRETPRRTRIMFTIFGLAFGGAETVLFELVTGLDANEFEPMVLSLAPEAALSARFRAAGVPVAHLGLRKVVDAPLTLFRALREAKRFQPDIVHGVLFYGDLTARLLRLFLRQPRIVSAVHSTYIGHKSYEYVMRYTNFLTDSVTAVSQAVADAQIAAGSIDERKTQVIPNGIDMKRFVRPSETDLAKLRHRFGIAPDARVLLCVGRLEVEKNHALLLDAFASLVPEDPRLVLLLAGPGRLEGELKARAEQLGISNRVVFAGQVDPVAPLFHLADVFVLSSSIEGLPMVVLEAMASGCAMVLTRVGGIPEVVEHQRTGVLVPSQNLNELSAALAALLKAPKEERMRLGNAARAEAEARYGTERMVSLTQALYRRLLSKPRG